MEFCESGLQHSALQEVIWILPPVHVPIQSAYVEFPGYPAFYLWVSWGQTILKLDNKARVCLEAGHGSWQLNI